jgi:predicted nucleotidyltransferase
MSCGPGSKGERLPSPAAAAAQRLRVAKLARVAARRKYTIVPVGSLGSPHRQQAALAAITRQLAAASDVMGALVVGSLAAGTADAASDIDLIICTRPGRFADAWACRHELRHATGALVSWDDQRQAATEIAVHRWVTPDLVLVEALFAAPGSGARLAQPWTLIAGEPEVAAVFPARPPINRSEMNRAAAHPVDQAFDDLKAALRRLAAGNA